MFHLFAKNSWLLLASLICAPLANANSFWLSNPPAVKRATHSSDIYVFLTPSGSNIAYGEAHLTLDPNDLAFVELAPVAQAHSYTQCALKNGSVVLTVYSKTLASLPKTNIAICRIRVRADNDALIQQYSWWFHFADVLNLQGISQLFTTTSNSISVVP